MKTTKYSPAKRLPTPFIGQSRSKPRAGIVLIVILGMLAILALVGIAFTTYSAQEERSSKNYSTTFATPRADQNPEALFVEILSQIIADTDNPLSVVRSHSLLR